MKYLDFFEEVYYINLDSRLDRKELFEKRALEQNIDAIRFSGIIPNDDEYIYDEKDKLKKFKIGCTLSHQTLVKIAKEKKLKNILIFEDDCVFVDKFKEKAQLCINELKNIIAFNLAWYWVLNESCTNVDSTESTSGTKTRRSMMVMRQPQSLSQTTE